jgi:hypothetical protein
VDEGEAELDVLHLLGRIFAIPIVQRHRAALGVRHQEGQFTRGDDRETAGLVAGIDVGDIGDAVARHVVMIERLAELLGRKHFRLDGAARILLDRGGPVFQRLLQRMRGRHPVRDLQLEGLVLRDRRRDAGGQQQRQEGFPHEHRLP